LHSDSAAAECGEEGCQRILLSLRREKGEDSGGGDEMVGDSEEGVVRVDEVHVLGVVGDGKEGAECGGDGVGGEARGDVA